MNQGRCSKATLVFQLYLRVFFSYAIDLTARDLIILLLPLSLAQSGNGMEFVLNAVAAYFITELDNLSEEREIDNWTEEFVKLGRSYGARLENNEPSACDEEEQSIKPLENEVSRKKGQDNAGGYEESKWFDCNSSD